MGVELSIPIERGQTGYGGSTPDASNLRFANQIGQIRVFPDQGPDGTQYSGLQVTAMLCRNLIGANLLPKQPVLLSATAIGNTGPTVTQSASPNVFFGIVDEYLPAAGVVDDDVFWLVLKGPTTALIESSGGVSGGQLFMPSASNNGKLDIIDPTPDNDLEAMNQAIYALAAAIGTIASGATEARVCLRGNQYGQ